MTFRIRCMSTLLLSGLLHLDNQPLGTQTNTENYEYTTRIQKETSSNTGTYSRDYTQRRYWSNTLGSFEYNVSEYSVVACGKVVERHL